MIELLAASLVLLAAPAFAATPLARAAVIASELGVSLPAATAPELAMPATLPVKAPRADAVSSGWASGNGWVTGNAFMNCSAPPNGSGWMNGNASLNGNVTVNGPEGTSGNINISGFVWLSGSCQNNQGYVSGSTTLDGWGTLYGRDGKPAGTARVSGTVFINQFIFGSFLFINQNVSVSGNFTANP